jgi:hypothetical protein
MTVPLTRIRSTSSKTAANMKKARSITLTIRTFLTMRIDRIVHKYVLLALVVAKSCDKITKKAKSSSQRNEQAQQINKNKNNNNNKT